MKTRLPSAAPAVAARLEEKGQGVPAQFPCRLRDPKKRRVPGRENPVQCVLLDSGKARLTGWTGPQEALDEKEIRHAVRVVDFSDYDPQDGDSEQQGKLIDAIGRVTSLQVPHRLADAILRDSDLNGTRFRESEKGRALNRASIANATPLFEMCPTALVFGMWDSTGLKGGLGAKF